VTESPAHLVVGGGVCGLYAALTLARGGRPVFVLERSSQVGGLAASVQHDGNPYDFGVHMLHGFDTELRDDLLALMGEEAIDVALDARIRWRGHDFRYPLRFTDLLQSMPLAELANGLRGLLWAGIKHRLTAPAPPRNAEEALIALYGAPLYHSFVEDFTGRYWGRPPRQLSADFVARKMPRLTALDAVRQALRTIGIKLPAPRVESALVDEILHYSRRGSAALPDAIAREIQRLGGEVLTDIEIRAIDLAADGAHCVTFSSEPGGLRQRPFGASVSTIPLASLVALLGEQVPADVQASAVSLQYRPMAVHGVLVKRDRCMDALYTYYRDRCFHRVSEPKNAGVLVQPAGHTLLLAERMCALGDAVWQGTDQAIAETVQALAAEGLCLPDEVVSTFVLTDRHAYPVFSLGFDRHLSRILSWLERETPIVSAGRQGTFSYPNMHQSMREGERAARRIAGMGISAAGCTRQARAPNTVRDQVS
jgi:protoporphyrinogen oxidase